MGYVCTNPSCRTSWDRDFADGKCPICRKSIIPTSLSPSTADPLASQTTHTGTLPGAEHLAAADPKEKILPTSEIQDKLEQFLTHHLPPETPAAPAAIIPGFIQTVLNGNNTPICLNVAHIADIYRSPSKDAQYAKMCHVTLSVSSGEGNYEYVLGESYEDILKKLRYAVR